MRAISSVGRATRLHREGHRFESCIAHTIQKQHVMLFLFTCARRRPTDLAGVTKNFRRNLFVTTRFKTYS